VHRPDARGEVEPLHGRGRQVVPNVLQEGIRQLEGALA
jgi:hypothetical protein